MSLLKIWFLVSAAAVAGSLIWAYVPILVPVLAVTAWLGILVAGIVQAARALERWNAARLQQKAKD